MLDPDDEMHKHVISSRNETRSRRKLLSLPRPEALRPGPPPQKARKADSAHSLENFSFKIKEAILWDNFEGEELKNLYVIFA